MKNNRNVAWGVFVVALSIAGTLAGTPVHAAEAAQTETSEEASPYAKEGFYTTLDKDGRLWVFREGSEEHKEYLEKGKPAKHVIRPGAGPNGVTLKAVDAETLDAYLAK